MADSRLVMRDGRVVENTLTVRQAHPAERRQDPLVLSSSLAEPKP
jgi:hypothetical protein